MGGKERTCYLMVPSSVTASSPAPLILLAHGSGRNGLSLMEKWKDLASKEGIVIVGPDALDRNGWAVPDDGPGFICALVDALRTRYPISARRLYLFGHSAGAVFALDMSLLESEDFAATVVHAGAFRAPGEFDLIKNATRKIPVAICVGDRDPFFPVAAVKATSDAMIEGGIAVELTVIKGHDHNYYDSASRINAWAWDFLRARALDADAKYKRWDFTR